MTHTNAARGCHADRANHDGDSYLDAIDHQEGPPHEPRSYPALSEPRAARRYEPRSYLAALLDAEDRPRLGPVLLELVEVALERREDVDDDRAEVDEDPVGGRLAFATDRPDAPLAEGLEDPVGDGTQLALGTAGADDEVVGDGREPGKVEEDDVGGLLVLGDLDDPPRHLERLPLRAIGRSRCAPSGSLGQAVGPRERRGCLTARPGPPRPRLLSWDRVCHDASSPRARARAAGSPSRYRLWSPMYVATASGTR